MPNVAPEVHSLMDRSDASCCCGADAAVVLQFRADRGVAPTYSDIVASRDATMKAALQRRMVGVVWEGGLALAGVMLMRKDEGHSGNTQIPSMKTSFRTRAHCEMTSGLQG